jgi:hypothetical protein
MLKAPRNQNQNESDDEEHQRVRNMVDKLKLPSEDRL